MYKKLAVFALLACLIPLAGSGTIVIRRVAAGNDCSVESEYLDELTSFSPTFFYDVDAGVLTTDGFGATALDDRSGNNYDLAQTTDSKKMDLNAAAQNGLDVLDGDNVDDHLTLASVDNTTDLATWFIVAKDVGAAYMFEWGDGSEGSGISSVVGGGDDHQCHVDTTTGREFAGNGVDFGDPSVPHIYECVYDGSVDTEMESLVDGVSQGTNTTVGPLGNTLSELSIGAANTDTVWPLEGWIAAFWLSDAEESSGDRDTIRACLNDRWAVY